MASEYSSKGIFSAKSSDVFSFGSLLLEIISGKRNVTGYRTRYGKALSLHEYVSGSTTLGSTPHSRSITGYLITPQLTIYLRILLQIWHLMFMEEDVLGSPKEGGAGEADPPVAAQRAGFSDGGHLEVRARSSALRPERAGGPALDVGRRADAQRRRQRRGGGGGAAVFLCTSSAAGAPVRQPQDAAELGGASP